MDELECELVVRMGNGSYKCYICGKIYSHKSHINRHMTVHGGGKVRHYCKLCPMEFFLQSDLHKHMLIHSGETVYKCEICDKKFSQSDGLIEHRAVHEIEHRAVHEIEHRAVHEGKNSFECDVCRKRYSQKRNLHRHYLLIHESIDKYGCGECRKQFTDKPSFVMHVQKRECMPTYQQAKITEDVTPTPSVTQKNKSRLPTFVSFETEEVPQCKVCLKTFAYRTYLYRHYHVQHPQFNCGCRSCEKRFDDESVSPPIIDKDGIENIENCSEEETSATQDLKTYESAMLLIEMGIPVCKVCFKKFSYRTGLLRHYHVLHPDYNCGCRSCKKRFDEETKITDESVNSSMELECDKKFKGKETMVIHVRNQECSASFEEYDKKNNIFSLASSSGFGIKDLKETAPTAFNDIIESDGCEMIKKEVISTEDLNKGITMEN